MLKLLFNIFDTLPVIIWISVEERIIYANQYFLGKLNHSVQKIRVETNQYSIQRDGKEASTHKYLSYHDSLTGLYNRAYFDQRIEEILQIGGTT